MSTLPPYTPPVPGHGPEDAAPGSASRSTRPACAGMPRLDVTQAGAIVGLCVMIWALTGAGYFWPMWPALGLAIGALKARRC